MKMRYRYKEYLLTAAVLGITLMLCGCTSKREETQEKYKQQGITAMTQQDYDKAMESFDKALAHSGHNVTTSEIDISFYKAAAQYLQGDFDGAVGTYTSLTEFDGDDYRPWFLRGSIYADENQMEPAMEDYKTAVGCDEDNYELYIQIYENLNALNHHEEGLEFLNLALEIDGNRAENYMQRGRIYMLLEQYDAAEKALQKAIDKKLGEAKIYMAQVYEAREEKDQAEAILKDYLDNDTVSGEAYNMIGSMKMEQQDYASALEYFQKGLALKNIDNKKDLLKNEIAALEHTGDFQGAKAKLGEFLKQYPTDEDALREQVFLNTR